MGIAVKREKGQYLTPRFIASAILDRLIKYVNTIDFNDSKIKIIEPSIGEGVFIELIVQKLMRMNFKAIEVLGYDIDEELLQLTDKKLEEFASDHVIIKTYRENYLVKQYEEFPKDIDLIIGNPPYGIKFTKEEWLRIRANLKLTVDKSLRSESSIFFTLKSLDIIRPKGILCLILPKPIIYSKRWSLFRKIIVTQFTLLEVLDLCNVFSGQLQEQCVLMVRKEFPKNTYKYNSAYYSISSNKIFPCSQLNSSISSKLDNLLVCVNKDEIKLIKRIYSNCNGLEVNAFRGLKSTYRVKNVTSIPLYEKANILNGLLAPVCNYVKEDIPKESYNRIRQPKIIAQRIITYKTKPYFELFPKVFVDIKGDIITHETVINIYPSYNNNILSNAVIAGLIQSDFVRWWLKHAVYTKRFVTSKDFDKEYIRSIYIPKINEFTQKKFHLLGDAYNKFQNKSIELKMQIIESCPETNQFKTFKKIYRQIMSEAKTKLINSHDYSTILHLKHEIDLLKNEIDEIVFSLYGLTKDDIKIIKRLN